MCLLEDCANILIITKLTVAMLLLLAKCEVIKGRKLYTYHM